MSSTDETTPVAPEATQPADVPATMEEETSPPQPPPADTVEESKEEESSTTIPGVGAAADAAGKAADAAKESAAAAARKTAEMSKAVGAGMVNGAKSTLGFFTSCCGSDRKAQQGESASAPAPMPTEADAGMRNVLCVTLSHAPLLTALRLLLQRLVSERNRRAHAQPSPPTLSPRLRVARLGCRTMPIAFLSPQPLGTTARRHGVGMLCCWRCTSACACTMHFLHAVAAPLLELRFAGVH